MPRIMPQVVFILCALTALTCAALLLRAYRATRTRLLLWSGICFAGLAANSAMVFIDLIIFPQISLIVVRDLIALASLVVLIAGFIWEGDRK